MESSNYNYTKQTQRVKLSQYGYEEAGQSMGEPQKFEGYLNEIYKGHLLDEDVVTGKTEEEKEVIRQNISTLRSEISDKKSLKKQIEEIKIPAEETKKQGLAATIEEIRKKIITGPQPNWMMFGFVSLVLLILSAYLFFFYIDLFSQVFYNVKVKSLDELLIAINEKPLVLVAPIVVFSLGIAIHVFTEQDNKFKYLAVLGIIILAFVLDFLMASQIHSKMNFTRTAFDQPEISVWEDASFWIVIFMGFVVYIIWSVLFHSIVTEYKKKDVSAWEQYQIKKIRKDIDDLTSLITNFKLDASKLEAECDVLNQKIEHENARIVEVLVSKNDLLHSLSQFSNGWKSYFRPDAYTNHREKLEETNKIVLAFEQKIDQDFKESNEKAK